jgi:hypothetical protein
MKGAELMMEKLLNRILFRTSRARKACEKFVESVDGQLTEEFLRLLLNAMRLVFLIYPEYRRNIKNFHGRYCFKSLEGGIETSVIFGDGKMEVIPKAIQNAHLTVNFKNPKALRNYILSPKPDILGSLLRQEVVPDGNFNYLYKFAYMAKRLQIMASGGV